MHIMPSCYVTASICLRFSRKDNIQITQPRASPSFPFIHMLSFSLSLSLSHSLSLSFLSLIPSLSLSTQSEKNTLQPFFRISHRCCSPSVVSCQQKPASGDCGPSIRRTQTQKPQPRFLQESASLKPGTSYKWPVSFTSTDDVTARRPNSTFITKVPGDIAQCKYQYMYSEPFKFTMKPPLCQSRPSAPY